MKLRAILRQRWQVSSPWDRVRLVGIVVLMSPVILAVYLGMWADGYLDKRNDRG